MYAHFVVRELGLVEYTPNAYLQANDKLTYACKIFNSIRKFSKTDGVREIKNYLLRKSTLYVVMCHVADCFTNLS